MAIQRLAHAELRVKSLDEALDFYKNVMGLVEIAREGQKVYLGCGLDEAFDLAVVPGGTGVVHFAFQVETEDDLAHYRKRLEDQGVNVESCDGTEPGQLRGIRFALPSGHQVELVLVEGTPTYINPSIGKAKHRCGIAPVDIDHITLQMPVPQVRPTTEFLRDVLDFSISDIFQPAPEVWAATWTRCGEYHHDLAIIGDQNPESTATLNHVAWQMESFDHIKRALDFMALAGYKVETGPGRHGIGGNIFAYFWEPGGNRFELSGEMPRATARRADPLFWDDFPKAFSNWGQMPPESFALGS